MKLTNPCKDCIHRGEKDYIINDDEGLHPWCKRLYKSISLGDAFYCKFKKLKSYEQDERPETDQTREDSSVVNVC